MPTIVNLSKTDIGVGTATLLPGMGVKPEEAGVEIVDGKFVEPGLEAWRRAGALAIIDSDEDYEAYADERKRSIRKGARRTDGRFRL